MLVGRTYDLDALLDALRSSKQPLTMVGPVGVGKSALAQAVYRQLQSTHNRSQHIDFARNGAGSLEMLESLLARDAASAPALLLIDNADGFHTAVRRCLNRAQNTCTFAATAIVITSRTRIGYDGESVIYLRPLSLLDGVELFRRSSLVQGRQDASWDLLLVTRIVRQLDCLPLAIRLCARHAVTTPLAALETALLRDRAWLENPDAEGQATHSSWDTALSQALADLSQDTHRVLAFLALFDEHFTFEDVVAAGGPTLEPLPHLTLLHEQSLLSFDSERSTYTLLNSVRLHVRTTTPARDAELSAFGEFLRRGAHHATEVSTTGDKVAWLIRHRLSLLDLLERTPLSLTESAIMLLAAARAASWCGPVKRTLVAMRRLDGDNAACLPAATHAALLQAKAKLHERLGDNELALQNYLLAQSVTNPEVNQPDATTSCANVEFQLSLLTDLGTFYRQQGSPDAQVCYAQALALVESPALRTGRARMWATLATRATEQDQFEQAEQLFESAIEAARSEDSPLLVGTILSNRGVLRQEQGRLAEARADFTQARTLHHQLGHQRFEAIALLDLGCLAIEEGRYPDATHHFESAAALASEVEDPSQSALALTLLATTVAPEARAAEIQEWFATALTMLERVGNPYLLAAHRVHKAQIHVNAAQQAFLAGDLDTHTGALRLADQALRTQWPFTSDEIRLAQRLLRRRVEACRELPHTVLVATDGGWLQKPPRERVRLKFDSPQRRVLCALVAHFSAGNSGALSADTLVRKAWPAESARHKPAMNRLHVALNALRKSGLSDHLQHSPEGYVLRKVLPQP